MIKEVELLLTGDVRRFEVGRNCEKISEVSEGVHGIRVVTTATATREVEEIIFIGVPYVLYIERT